MMGERNASDQRLSIGAFSRRSRLSLKALRLYERQGLLMPDSVDPGNGYRWYRESQLGVARLIVLLRWLDMPLPLVAEVVAAAGSSANAVMGLMPRDGVPSSEKAAALIGRYWGEVERNVAFQRELATHLQNRLLGSESSGRHEMFEIHEREVPQQTVLTEQRHIRVNELSDWMGAAFGRLWALAERLGGGTGAAFAIFHGEVTEESDGPVEICVPVNPPADAGTDVAIRIEPAHREAYTRIRKAQVQYPQILSAYEAVSHWISTNNRTMAGSPREVYFTDFMNAKPDDEACDIAYPIE